MEWMEVIPLPAVCEDCGEEDCYNCESVGNRWRLSEEDALRIRKNGLMKAKERLQRQVDSIDRQLTFLAGRRVDTGKKQ